MSESESFLEGNHLVAGGSPPSLSELFFSNDGNEVGAAGDMAHALRFSSTGKSPRMLCFGGRTYHNESHEIVMFSTEATTTTPQIPGVTCSDSSSASSGNNSTVSVISTISKSNVSIWLKFTYFAFGFFWSSLYTSSFAEKKNWVKAGSNSEEYQNHSQK